MCSSDLPADVVEGAVGGEILGHDARGDLRQGAAGVAALRHDAQGDLGVVVGGEAHENGVGGRRLGGGLGGARLTAHLHRQGTMRKIGLRCGME